jgi:hypothetical protein
VTENKAVIRWSDAYGNFGWREGKTEHALRPQPPLSVSEVEETPVIKSSREIGATSGGHEIYEVPMVKPPEPGETCQLCERRLPHPKKESSPKTTVVKSWRLPAEEKESREETLEATALHLGINPKEKFWMDKLILNLCIIALRGPRGDRLP